MNAHFTSTFRCDCNYNKNEELCLRCRRGDTSFVKNIIPGKESRKRLSHNEVKELEKDITEDEIDKYVKKFFRKEGKSPGPDGLPYIFIFKMWTHLKKIIMTLLIKSFRLGEFNKELSEGLIVFLHKNGKPTNEIKGWRPLTLLNSVYKIASGVLAQRIKKFINKITHEHQYGFVSGKNASDMVELLNKIMSNSKRGNLHTVLLALDFKGAFDTVRHEAIIRALKMKGFGPKYINWVAALLANNESKLVINGRTNDDYKIKVKRSARQGDPLSPYLFILVLDELLERMDCDDILEGIVVENKIINSLAFADDNYTAIVDTLEGIKLKVARIIKIMEKFRRATGLTINVTKSEILCNDKTTVENLKEIENIDLKTTITSLGIPIGADASIENQIQNKLEASIRHWAKMGLNMVERIEVYNVLILPKIIHLLRHLKFNKLKCDEWYKMIKSFIWNNKKANIKSVILEDDWSRGGWGMTSLKVAWQKLNVNWVLRSKEHGGSIFLDEIREELEREGLLNVGNQVLSGAGKTVTKKDLEYSNTLKEAAIKIYRWTYDDFLKKEICMNHQPLINNRRVLKNGKNLIKLEDIPEVDFGSDLDIETLKEMEINLEMMDEENLDLNKELTADLFRRLKRNRPLPENEACECRLKIRALNDAKSSFKNFKMFLRSSIIRVEDNTVNRVSASTFLYDKVNINNSSLLRQLKATNPRQNYLLNARCVLLRQKIRYKVFYTRLDLFRMKVNGVNDPNCHYCKGLECPPKEESLRHLLTECKVMINVWEFFRTKLDDEWNIKWSDAEMVYGPVERSPRKLKAEYVFLRIMNRFTGLRSEGNFDTDVITPLKKTCEDLINTLTGVFDDKFRTTMNLEVFANNET